MAELSDSAARDLDETRRLLYMSLVVGKTKKYNLAGTLINALRHHQGVTDSDLEAKIVSQLESADPDETWVRGLISDITTELGVQ